MVPSMLKWKPPPNKGQSHLHVEAYLKSIQARSRINSKCQLWAWHYSIFSVQGGVVSHPRGQLSALSFLLPVKRELR